MPVLSEITSPAWTIALIAFAVFGISIVYIFFSPIYAPLQAASVSRGTSSITGVLDAFIAPAVIFVWFFILIVAWTITHTGGGLR